MNLHFKLSVSFYSFFLATCGVAVKIRLGLDMSRTVCVLFWGSLHGTDYNVFRYVSGVRVLDTLDEALFSR